MAIAPGLFLTPMLAELPPETAGAYGQGLTGVRPDIASKLLAKAWDPAEGTLMAWLKLVRRPRKAFYVRWLLILDGNRMDAAISDTSRPFLLNAGAKDNPADRWLPDVPTDAFFCQGYEGQFVTVIPSGKLVIVRLGLSVPFEAWDHNGFVSRVVAAVN